MGPYHDQQNESSKTGKTWQGCKKRSHGLAHQAGYTCQGFDFKHETDLTCFYLLYEYINILLMYFTVFIICILCVCEV